MVSINLWGHGVGCSFIKIDCLGDGEVPEYSNSFFCPAPPLSLSLYNYPSDCDYSHNLKASCDIVLGAN